MYTLIIKNALVFVGNGEQPALRDIAVHEDKIVAIEEKLTLQAARLINADGLAAAPGFIDIHSHSDKTITAAPSADSKLRQGVTTEVVCNCGIGPFPSSRRHQKELETYFSQLEGDGQAPLSWEDFTDFSAAVSAARPALNIAPLVGHGALRIAVLGNTTHAPSSSELARMEALLAENLRQGAWGMSTGLIYPPGSFAKTDELVALGKVLHRFGSLYSSHIRGESATLADAVDEAITICRESGSRTLISHLKAIGRPYWGHGKEALNRLKKLRADGLDIWADQYPYTATATVLSALLPVWAQTDWPLPAQAPPSSPERLKLLKEIETQIAIRGGADSILVTTAASRDNSDCAGHILSHIALTRKVAPAEAVRQILAAETHVNAVFFSLSETELEAIMRDPDVLIASDGYAFDDRQSNNLSTHPRSFGTFPRVLGRYVREKQLISPESAIRKMTFLPAYILGLPARGLLKPGYKADIVLFDPKIITDNATYEKPALYPSGIHYVIVNGIIAVEENKPTGNRAGIVLKKQPQL